MIEEVDMDFGKEQDKPINLEEKLGKDSIIDEVDSKVLDNETATQSVLRQMFGKKDKKDKSDLMFEEVGNLTRLQFIFDRFDLTAGKNLINNFLTFRVSMDRKGRGEGFGAVKDENVNTGTLINKLGLFGKSM